MSLTLVVENLAERCFEVIREKILTGELGDGAPVRQHALALELGISKVPLREALTKLEDEGLVTSQANKGWVVSPLSLDQAREIMDLRLALEPDATAHAASLASDAEREGVVLAAARCIAAPDVSIHHLAVRQAEFHLAMVRPGARTVTTRMVRRLNLITERYAVVSWISAAPLRANTFNAELLEAWLAGDGHSVRQFTKLAILETFEPYRRRWTD